MGCFCKLRRRLLELALGELRSLAGELSSMAGELADDPQSSNVRKNLEDALRYVSSICRPGGFGSECAQICLRATEGRLSRPGADLVNVSAWAAISSLRSFLCVLFTFTRDICDKTAFAQRMRGRNPQGGGFETLGY